MKSFLLFSIIFSLQNFVISQALKCPTCWYINGVPNPPTELDRPYHESCANGKTAENQYATECAITFKTKQNANSSTEAIDCSCGMVFVEELPEWDFPGFTLRGCVPTVAEFDGKCVIKTLKQLREDTSIPPELKQVIDQIPSSFDNISGNICLNKNGVKDDPGNSPGSVVQISALLLPLTIVVARHFGHV